MKSKAFDHSKYPAWIDPNEVRSKFKEYERGKYWVVYMHIFPNEKKYIGITSRDPFYRWVEGGKGYKQQSLIWNAIQKHGWENVDHVIVKEAYTRKEAEQYERHLIREFKTDNREYGYNVESGGHCARGYKLSEETRKKMSVSRTGEKNWIYGKHLTEETKKKLSEAHKGKCDIEAIRRSAKNRMGGKAYNARPVRCYDIQGNVIGDFPALADGARKFGIRTQDVYSCCIGRQKTTHGMRWEYIEEVVTVG